MRLKKSAADYAAIAVAPLLIFIMISSLANFLTLVLYHGEYPSRVMWTLLMFTMGSVAVARLAIEQDRAYSLGYAFALGLAAFATMLRFVDSPLFCAFILLVIGYLADVIVRDCTLIEDDVDASGQGLIDSGRLFVTQQMRATNTDSKGGQEPTKGEQEVSTAQKIINAHQPGRTILYVAVAALPLFGLGQFMMRSDPSSWTSAKRLLAFYLFSSLSLLVTTSFLGLRRYLRQRGVEMPDDVTVSWLAGGVALIAAVLFVAYAAPTPGRALASIELAFLDSPDGLTASRWGWGDEAAEKSTPDDAQTSTDPNSEGKQTQGMRSEKGAPAGDVNDGEGREGPTGKQQGGSQQSQGSGDQKGDAPQPQDSSSDSSSAQSPHQDGSQQQSSSPQKGQQQPSTQNERQNQNENQRQSPQQTNQRSTKREADDSSPPDSQSEPQTNTSDAGDSDEDRQNDESESESDANQDPAQSESEKSESTPGNERGKREVSQSQPQPARPPSSIGNFFSTLGGILKWIIILVLVAVVGRFLFLNREAIAEWWRRLFERETTDDDIPLEQIMTIPDAPPRPFSSFSNPVGQEADPRKVLVITFQAFEAWSREQGIAREKDETPAEFVKRATQSAPITTPAASQVVDAYNRIVYGRGRASQRDLAAATEVWQFMRS